MLAIIKRAATLVGGGKPNYSLLARELGAPRPALYVWSQVPSPYVLRLEEITAGKIKRWEIRPDLHPPEQYTGRNKIFQEVRR